jgi:uncharacterized protein (UPF0332 family)
LASLLPDLKKYTYESEFYSKACSTVYKSMFLLDGGNGREVLYQKIFNTPVDTGLIILSNQNFETLENLDTPYLQSLADDLIFIETGGDGKVKVEIEVIGMSYPYLSILEYKKDIIRLSDKSQINVANKLFVSDGRQQNPKNILEIALGKYYYIWYEFANKYKIVLVLVK